MLTRRLTALCGPLALCLSVACGGSGSDADEPSSTEPVDEAPVDETDEPGPTGSDGAITEQRAIELAREAGAEAGYDLAIYPEVSASPDEGGGFTVHFQQADPAPPGGHFGVQVAPDGSTTVHEGE